MSVKSGILAFKSGAGFIIHVLVSTAAGVMITGITNATSGLKINFIRPGDASVTSFTGSNLETITTIGTFQAPSSGKIRIKEIDATNMPGWYEVHIAAANVPSGAGTAAIRIGITDTPNLAGLYCYNELAFTSLDLAGTAGANAQLFFNGTGYAGGTAKLDVNVVSFDSGLTNFNTGLLSVDLGAVDGTLMSALPISDGYLPVDIVHALGGTIAGSAGVISVNAIQVNGVAAPTLVNVYDAFVDYAEDASNGHFTVRWRKNGVPVAVTGTPQINLKSRADDSNTLAATNMTQVGTGGTWKYDWSTKLTAGIPVKVV
jgi:hypothetical protein